MSGIGCTRFHKRRLQQELLCAGTAELWLLLELDTCLACENTGMT